MLEVDTRQAVLEHLTHKNFVKILTLGHYNEVDRLKKVLGLWPHDGRLIRSCQSLGPFLDEI